MPAAPASNWAASGSFSRNTARPSARTDRRSPTQFCWCAAALAEHMLPSGAVTFVFTDIEGSTRLLRALGERYAAVLDRHRELLRIAFAAEGGVEVDSEGDALFLAFHNPAAALRGAVAGQ